MSEVISDCSFFIFHLYKRHQYQIL